MKKLSAKGSDLWKEVDMTISIDIWLGLFVLALVFILGLIAGGFLARPHYYRS